MNPQAKVETVFDRLYRIPTASSVGKQQSIPKRTCVSSPRSNGVATSTIVAKTPTPASDSSVTRLSRPTVSTNSKHNGRQFLREPSAKETQSQPKSAPSETLQSHKSSKYNGPWRLTWTSKYDRKESKSISTLSISALKLREVILGYESGKLDECCVASAVITALFERDFMPGRHWDIDSATVSSVVGDGCVAFDAEKQATWDWKDIYSVASSKGTVCFYNENHEIRVSDYSYYVAG